MVDDHQETTGMSAAGSEPVSNSLQKNNPLSKPSSVGSTKSTDIEEAHIIDEVVIPASKPPTSVPSPIPAPAPAPAPAPKIVTPEPPASTPPPLSKLEVPAPQETPPKPSHTTQPPEKSMVLPEKRAGANPFIVPEKDALSETPPILPETTPTPSGEKKEDIQKILSVVKMPERITPPGQSEIAEKKTTYDTSLASPLSSTPREKNGSDPVNTQIHAEVTSERSDEGSSRNPASMVVPVHTLKDDFQDIVREKKMSVVRAAALEQDKKRGVDKRYDIGANAHKRHTFGIVFASILLALLGTAAFFGVAIIMQERNGITPTQANNSLLFSENTLSLPLENLSAFDIKRLLSQARVNTNSTLGSITRIVPVTTGEDDTATERPATFEEFLRAIGAHISPELTRALGSDFFFGFHTVDENAPLLVVSVSSYERAFAGMLDWESSMNADLAPIFTPVPDTELGESGLLEKRKYEDLVMRNYDIRALKDNAGTIQLYYSFPTRNILIIAESPYSFAEVLSRLRADRKI